MLTLLSKAGSGTYGTVYICSSDDVKINGGKNFALKMIMYDLKGGIFEESMCSILRETWVMSSKHSSVRTLASVNFAPEQIPVRSILQEDEQPSPRSVGFAMPLGNYTLGHLAKYCKEQCVRLPHFLIKSIIYQITSKIQKLHKNLNCMHRDIKPANILLHNGEAKLSDFGFSKVVEAGMEEKIL